MSVRRRKIQAKVERRLARKAARLEYFQWRWDLIADLIETSDIDDERRQRLLAELGPRPS